MYSPGETLSLMSMVGTSDNCAACLFVSFNAGYAAVVCKIDASGNILWTEGLNNGSYSSFSSMVPTSDGGVVISGGVA